MCDDKIVIEGVLTEHRDPWGYYNGKDEYASRSLEIGGITIAVGRDDHLRSDLEKYIGRNIRIEIGE